MYSDIALKIHTFIIGRYRVWDDRQSLYRITGRLKNSFNWAVEATPLLTGFIDKVSYQYIMIFVETQISSLEK